MYIGNKAKKTNNNITKTYHLFNIKDFYSQITLNKMISYRNKSEKKNQEVFDIRNDCILWCQRKNQSNQRSNFESFHILFHFNVYQFRTSEQNDNLSIIYSNANILIFYLNVRHTFIFCNVSPQSVRIFSINLNRPWLWELCSVVGFGWTTYRF